MAASGGSIIVTLCFFTLWLFSVSLALSTGIIAVQIHDENTPHSNPPNPNPNPPNPNPNLPDPNSMSLFAEIAFGVSQGVLCTVLLAILVSKCKCNKLKSDRNWLNFSSLVRSIFDVTVIFFVRLGIHWILPSQSLITASLSLQILPAIGLQMVINTFFAIMLRKGLLEFFAILSNGVANLLLFAQTVDNWIYICGIWGSYGVIFVIVAILVWIYPEFASGGAAH